VTDDRHIPTSDSPVIDFELDPAAEPGDIVAALAALLVEACEAEGASKCDTPCRGRHRDD